MKFSIVCDLTMIGGMCIITMGQMRQMDVLRAEVMRSTQQAAELAVAVGNLANAVGSVALATKTNADSIGAVARANLLNSDSIGKLSKTLTGGTSHQEAK